MNNYEQILGAAQKVSEITGDDSHILKLEKNVQEMNEELKKFDAARRCER